MRMNLDLLAGTPVKLHDGIVVDQYLETNIAGVFAAGDIAEFYDVTTERHNMMGTWGNAAGHGRVAGLNMAGQRTVYEDIPMYSSSLFNSYIRVIGLTPENCPDLEACIHLDKDSRSYQRLFFLDNRLVGAVLIGDMRSRQKIFAAIRSRLTADPADRPALVTSWTS
jgi:NAD(P)H-nitrite reductase large subunit